jgi:cell division septal protein FtsQ
VDGGGGVSGFKRFVMQLVLLTTIALAITASYHLSVSHPFFDIKAVGISGNNTVILRELQEDRAHMIGANIFTADLEAAMDRFLINPWIKSVSIERRFPSSLHVTIRERKPVAEAIVSGRRYYIDAEGLVLGHGENYSGRTDLLLITGFDKYSMPGEILDEVRVFGAYDLKLLFDRETAFSDHASMVDAAQPDRLRVITDSGVSVTFGPEREMWKEKFLEYIAVRKILSEQGESAESIDLSFKGQVVVTGRGIVVQSAGKKVKGPEGPKTGKDNNKKTDRG